METPGWGYEFLVRARPDGRRALTIRLPQPVTVAGLGVAVTVSKGLAMPAEVAFTSGGRELVKARLGAQRGVQKLRLSQPATVQELSLQVVSIVPGEQVWGSLGEIEGYDGEGKNVLLCRPRQVPRAQPEDTLRQYRLIRSGDPTRPVFMTLTGHFHPFFKQNNDEQRATGSTFGMARLCNVPEKPIRELNLQTSKKEASVDVTFGASEIVTWRLQ